MSGLSPIDGVRLIKRAPIYVSDPKERAARSYHAVYCAACDVVIGRIPHGVDAMESRARTRVAKVAHLSECDKRDRGAWLSDGEKRWRRQVRKGSTGKPSIVLRIEERGVAFRWIVRAGSGLRNMDEGWTNTRKQAMQAAEECAESIVARGK